MKILQVIGGLGTGGAEKLLVDSIPLMTEKGNEVDLLLLNGTKTPFLEILERNKACRIFSLGKSFYNPLYIFKMIPYLKKYDMVHVHLFPALYFVAVAKWLSTSNTKIIFTEHNTENRRMNDIKFRLLEKAIYKAYSRVICISSKVKERLANILNIDSNKLVLIENGVNVGEIKNVTKANRKSFNYNHDDMLLIMIAAFRKQKDQDTIIKALKKLPSNYKLLLVGDGERRDHIVELVSELALSDRVSFLGQRTDVYSLLKMSDIAILSSHWEGFGLAAVESMASGIPLLASDVDGLSQVVENGGVLFEKGNVDDLVNKILEFNNKEYYYEISQKGMKKAQNYDISTYITKLIEVYHSVLN
ncbi:glycosyltransferase [Chryseobacterium carnipullorum]|uniref:glycosyltransferase n=1 Tax=Chryseobacterium carnipullorum TaxID=1124835 RepID=UPI000E84C0EB|nr:glycosyltransferase [Chryseobacterium carnipullorum]HBV14170.1 glycosyltransferase [Chryseobacterium carnipullorum]